MRRFDFLLAALLALSIASCGGENTAPDNPDNNKENTDDNRNNGGNSGKDDDGKDDSQKTSSPWVLSTSRRLSSVEVYSGSALIESYKISYDGSGRVSTLLAANELSGETLYDLSYSYSSDSEASIEGKYFGTSSTRTITATADSVNLVSKGDWGDAWNFTTKYDKAGTVLSVTSSPSFSFNGYYSSSLAYAEEYSLSSGNAAEVKMGTSINASSDKGTATRSSYDVTYNYEYSDSPDRQNFAVFLMPCQFPVWYAKGLPGNANLLTGMSMKLGSIEGQVSFTVDYELDSEGNISTATRTDYAGTDVLMTRTYRLTYAK